MTASSSEQNLDMAKILKEHEHYKLMELSEESKLALKRVQRYTPKNYS